MVAVTARSEDSRAVLYNGLRRNRNSLLNFAALPGLRSTSARYIPLGQARGSAHAIRTYLRAAASAHASTSAGTRQYRRVTGNRAFTLHHGRIAHAGSAALPCTAISAPCRRRMFLLYEIFPASPTRLAVYRRVGLNRR